MHTLIKSLECPLLSQYLKACVMYILLNSIFALATPEELKESLARWRGSINDGTADQYLEESEKLRKTLGLSTSLVAYKL